jgi:hypothetical protein
MLLKPRPSTRPATTAPAEKWPETLVHRALNAHFRLGTAENAQAVAKFAAMNESDEVMRIEALAMLQEWDAPRGIDRVVGTWHPLEKRDVAIAKNASAPVIEQIIKSSPDTVRIAAIELLKKTNTDNKELLHGVATNKEMSPDVAAAALAAMDALNDARLAGAVDFGIKEGRGALRSKAIEFLSRRPDAVAQLDKILTEGNIADQQAVLTALGKIESQASDAILSTWMDRPAEERRRAGGQTRPARGGGRVEVARHPGKGARVRGKTSEDRFAGGISGSDSRRRRVTGPKDLLRARRRLLRALPQDRRRRRRRRAGPVGRRAEEGPKLPA